MDMKGNTIAITGGGSGIGRALAEAFFARGNKVIISGRRRDALDAVVKANPGMISLPLDLSTPHSIGNYAKQLLAEHPDVNVLINNAGIMAVESFASSEQQNLQVAEQTVTTNLLGPIRLTSALLPHLRSKPNAVVLMVTSGLAFVPLSVTPTYSATKAALHSYTQSLRHLLKSTPVQVIEVIPPKVQTELMGPSQAVDPTAMPLKDFVDEVMNLLSESSSVAEVLVERVKALRNAERSGGFDAIFEGLNSRHRT